MRLQASAGDLLFGPRREISLDVLVLGTAFGLVPVVGHLTWGSGRFVCLCIPETAGLWAATIAFVLLPAVAAGRRRGFVAAWWLVFPSHAVFVELELLEDAAFIAASTVELVVTAVVIGALTALLYASVGYLAGAVSRLVYCRIHAMRGSR